MKRAILAISCAAFLLALAPAAQADPAFDQDMAGRYLRAAQSGDDDAQFYIGALYAAGVGVPRSDEEAFRWFSRAANQGHSHAMLLLADFYAVGRGVQPNNIQAYKWAHLVSGASRVKAFRSGALQLIGVIEARMTPDEIKRAKADAAQWHALTTAWPTDADATTIMPAPPAMAAPAPAPANPSRVPPVNATNNRPSPDLVTQKNDASSFFDRVPQGPRKRFGFRERS